MEKSDKARGAQDSYGLAFTLAEVLITLAIIGIVAALTIPTVVKNYQKTEALTKLKKAYSAFANATNLAVAEHGPIRGWEIKDYNDGGTGKGSIDFANKYLVPYLKVSNNCENKTTGLCQAEWNYLNRTGQGFHDSRYSRFYLNDGTLIVLLARNYIDYDNNLYYQYAYVYIDINGQKKPNMFGKDVFRFIYYIHYGPPNDPSSGKFLPFAYDLPLETLIQNGYSYSCNRETNGDGCAALIMKQGWQMTDDYPW